MLTFLSAYDFSIQQRAGRLHSNCDALSRRPCVEVNCKYCERVERKFSGEQEENDQDMVSINRIGQTGSSLETSRKMLGFFILQLLACILTWLWLLFRILGLI